MSHELLWAAFLALIFAIVVEMLCDVCRRLAARLVGWSARMIYADNRDRAIVRECEWKAMIVEAPKFLALIKALPFLGVAVGKGAARRYRGRFRNGAVHVVKGYYRKDGRWVRPHRRKLTIMRGDPIVLRRAEAARDRHIRRMEAARAEYEGRRAE